MKLSNLAKLVLIASISSLTPKSFADSIDITLMQSTQTGQGGITLTFDVSVTNLTNSTVYLNGASATSTSSFLTVLDSPFLLNAPLSVSANSTTAPFIAFTVFIAPGTPVGNYGLNNFSILGGSGSNNLNLIGSTEFGVNVSSAPEPASIFLMCSGGLGLAIAQALARRSREERGNSA